MARYRPEHKEETHRRLVESAITAFRRAGVGSAGLKQIMHQLGQTVGGFYRHFPSKSGLVEAAVARGVLQSLEHMRSIPDAEDASWVEQFLAGYLSEAHRRGLAHGCVLAALGSDIARGERGVKAVCEEGLRQLHAEMRRHWRPGAEQSDDALWGLTALVVGGLLLSRMVATDKTAAEILAACRRTARTVVRSQPPAGQAPPAKRSAKKAPRPVGGHR
jgi:TetR/AcrR family transcriptional repressor of nem operon